ncbi:MAG: carbohydrate ABC transporter permease [Candidatus Omnitrophica bacterium]|nr:carbohydrate ABC transporter permease [Candidatus Omnitrophota bacterium]MCA9426266.1 carbohydrate ABC transporter permease [Candidatus Omnitrophota bacterium]MCA9431267.1 carbohydrate ABC transporter permease [Candidatus Omnitrophota bacterium]MCA9434794.1 carbohydrate ABC transporter permease [Candidatus Omnitrophota bacterium]MCA9442722.1 carbohydrate ABC transporter permease [Candidatus Omnitrophota bacterium]
MPPEWLPRTTIYKAEINGTQISRAEVSWTPPENRIDPTEQFPADVDIAWVRPHGSEVAYRAVPKKNLELQGRVIDFRWENYVGAVHAIPFWRYTKNTLWLCVLSVFGTLLSSALVAYGFSRIQWRGRDQLFLLVLATMMIPFPVIMIPLYSLFRGFGLIGTMVPLWLPTFFGNAFFIFLLRQFFRGIPDDLTDAARIDGCSEWRIFWNIICPLSHSALIVVAIFKFIETWNDFLAPFIFLTDQEDFTLALGLQFFQSQHGGTDWHYLMAASTLVTLPVILLFFFAQRRFIEGISMTGMKN